MLGRSTSRLCLVVAALGITLFSAASRALDLKPWLDRAGTATDVTVFLVPSMMNFRFSLDETAMQRFSCRYSPSDPEAVTELIDMLKTADVKLDAVYQRPDMREGVYLTFADGSHLTFMLQDNYGGRTPVLGVVETFATGEFQSAAFMARSTLAADVRTWASTKGGPGAGYLCRNNQPPGPLPPIPEVR
jgi:hypothetical protein